MGRRVCGVGARRRHGRRTPRRDLRRTGQRPFYRGTGKYFNRSPTRHPPSRLMTGRKYGLGRPGTAIGIGTDERRAGSAPLETPARGPVARWLRSAQPRWWSPGATGAGGGYPATPVAPRAVSPLPSTVTLLPKTRDVEQRLGGVGAWDLGLAAARLNSMAKFTFCDLNHYIS
jgi:hypothetical protein